jgi:flavin reductase (DIM6/NTAB) family NADH-FMN oxidoreductase RutF
MDLAIKKQVLRHFTYGLYGVTCIEGENVNAFTANWVTQVSFEPPLVAVSIENDARSLPMIERTRRFAICVLRSGEGQREFAGNLGKSGIKHPGKMQGIAYAILGNGYVTLEEAISWVACEVRQTVLAGDSTLMVGEVVDAGVIREGEPLTMKEAGFRHAG